MRYVYLAGPITGATSLETVTSWRTEVRQKLRPDIECIDPTRDNPDINIRASVDADDREQLERARHGAVVVARDRMDVARSDLLLANLAGADRASIGAVGEIFWADAFRKPIVVVRERSGNPHDHDMINALACYVTDSLGDALEKVRLLLSNA